MAYGLTVYLHLLRALAEGRLTVTEFSDIYVFCFKADRLERPRALFDVLQGVFAAAECFDVEDPHPPYSTQEEDVLKAAREALPMLRGFAG